MTQGVKAVRLEDEAWERLLEQTHGSVGLCFQCGACTASCPWGQIDSRLLNVRRLLREAQLTARGDADVLWLCTLCRQCELLCPRGVEVIKVIRELRSHAFSERSVPAALEEALWSLLENFNPLGYPPSQRGRWCRDLSIPPIEQGEGVLLYAGSAACYDPRIQVAVQSLARLMSSAGVVFGTLGEDERDSGDLVRYVGEKGFLREVIRNNISVFEDRGVKTIVAFSPHDYEMFRFVYPDEGGQYEVYHYAEYLARLLDAGRLPPVAHEPPAGCSPAAVGSTAKSDGQEIRVIYHDPCYLSRYGALTREPREVLHSLPGVTVEEFEDNRVNTLCCGGGGGRMFLETAAGERFANLRVREAAERGVAAIVTACPFCVQNFEDSLRTQQLDGLQILDLAEFTAQRVL